MNQRQENDWEGVFDRLPVDTSPSETHRQDLKARVSSAYEDRTTLPAQRIRLKEIGKLLMRYKAPHLTAATILVATIVWLVQTNGTEAFALDDVVKNLVKARSARFATIVTVTGQPPQKMTAYYLEPNHFRQELVNGYINISDWQAGKTIGLDPKTKQATVFNLVNVPAEAKSGMQMNHFDGIRESLRTAVDDPDTKVESLGEKELDGRRVVGFRFKTLPQTMTLWADPETKLPVLIEATMVGPPETKVVMTDYEFNVELDKSLFSVDIPEGYTVTEMDIDASPTTEKEFIAALRMCTEGGSEFPQGFDAAAIGSYVGTYLTKQGIDKEKGPNAQQLKDVLQISRGFQFAMTLPAESDAHLAGVGATPGDADRAVFWYKPVGGTNYRVIYADFSVKESDTAPQVPGAKKLAP